MASESQPITSGKDGRVLLITSLVSSLIMLDSTIVAVSLPAIGHSFGVPFSSLEWVISAYLLTYASLLLGSGAFGDLRGRKLTLIAGLIIFGTASAACGLAPSVLTLNIARAIQGVGGAMLLTAALAVIGTTFDGPRRGAAVAIWGAYLGVALTLGPVLGGIITRYLGWRWVFLVNVPACAVLIIASARSITESHDPEAKRLDWAGMLTFSPGLLLLTWGLISGNDAGWDSLPVLLMFAGSIICLVAFVLSQKHQRRPMIDLSLFSHRSFRGAVFAMIGYGATAQVMVFYLPLYLQNAYGFNPLVAGLAMLPFPLPMVLAPRLTLRLSKTWSGRKLLTTGLMITALGNILFWGVARTGLSYPIFVLTMIVAGTGAGLLNGETVRVLTSSVPPERSGMASGIASTTRLFGILVGVAGLGAILAAIAGRDFINLATHPGLSMTTLERLVSHVTSGDLHEAVKDLPVNIRTHTLQAGQLAFSRGFGIASLAAAAIAAISAILSFYYISATDPAPQPTGRISAAPDTA